LEEKKNISQSNLVLVMTATTVQWQAFPPECVVFHFVTTFNFNFQFGHTE